MDLQTRKLELIQGFLKVQSEDVILRIENILNNETKKFIRKKHTPMSIQEFNSRIDQSMEDSKSGRLISSSDLKVKIEQWK